MRKTKILVAFGILPHMQCCVNKKKTVLTTFTWVDLRFDSLMFSFMVTTFFLSMWISNTATTAMMLPIVEAVFQELKRDKELKDEVQHIRLLYKFIVL